MSLQNKGSQRSIWLSKEASPQIYFLSAVMQIWSPKPGWMALKIKIRVQFWRGFNRVSDDPVIYLGEGRKEQRTIVRSGL